MKTSYEALTWKHDDHLMNFNYHKESDVQGQNKEEKRHDMQLPFSLSYLKMSVFWSPFFTRIAILEKKKSTNMQQQFKTPK